MGKTVVAGYRLGRALVLLMSAPVLGWAQQGDSSAVGQVVLSDSTTGRTPAAANQGRAVTLDLHAVTLAEVLREIVRQGGIELVYSKTVVPLDRRISLKVASMPALRALAIALQGLDVSVQSNGRAWLLVPKQHSGTMVRSGSIEGRITDAKTGEGVARAEVWLEKTNSRTISDTAGRYRLAQVDSGQYTLSVRRLGYAKQSQRVTVLDGQTDTVNVLLEPVAARLQELVTTATGQRRRLDIANDVTTINADSVVRGEPITSVTDLLEGRVPGLTVQHTSGAPGDPARLRLRGAASPLRNNDPIVVVDGIRVYAEQSAARSANLAGARDTNSVSTSSYATPSPLDYIDPNIIETIEVLKGPSAATLYGQDAANGVIVITTKKGKAGPTRWTATADHGRSRVAGDYPELFLRWGHNYSTNQPVICPLTWNFSNLVNGLTRQACIGDSLVTFQLLNDPDLTVLGQGRRTAFTLGASGGSPALTYAVTGSYQDETGLPQLPTYEVDRYEARVGANPPDWMQRPQHLRQWSANSRLAIRLGSRADLSLTTNLSRTTQQRSSLEQQLDGLMSVYLDRASGIYWQRKGNNPSLEVADDILTSYFQRATGSATQLTNGANLNWRALPWFTVTSTVGINVIQRADEIFLPRGATTGSDSIGGLSDGRGTTVLSTINVGGQAQVPVSLGFQFRFAAGAEYTGRSISDLTGQSTDVAPSTSLLGGQITGLSRSVQNDATFGWYLEPSIGNSKFNFSSGLRLDGGSAYGSSASGLSLPKFPKLGFSYLLSDEPFFPLKQVIQSFRLRVAYGKASRQPGPADQLRLYTGGQVAWGDGQFVPETEVTALGNTDLRPERTTELEGGFDADLFDGRLSVSLTGYRKTTDDALLSVPVAPSVYGASIEYLKNIGLVRNTGLELDMTGQLVRSGPVTFGVQLSVSQNRNVVVELGPGVDPFYTQVADGGGIRVAPGYPLFGRWSRPILGYADANGNGLLESTEIQVADTAVYVGSTLPNYTANLHTTMSLWHGAVSLTTGFQYQDGLSQKNEVALRLAPFSRGWNDPTASIQEQAATIDAGGVANLSDYNWIQTISTMRFQSVAVTYRIPGSVAHKLGAQLLQLSLQGTNLGLWSNYRGLDPNVNAFVTGNNVTDTGVLPQPRAWQVRVNATY